jgi:hypothetical protein
MTQTIDASVTITKEMMKDFLFLRVLKGITR